MLKIPKRYKLFFLVLFFCTRTYAQESIKSVRLGLIADIQYADKENGKTRYYRASLQKLKAAVQQLNQDTLLFTVVLGDLVDEGPKDLNPIMEHLRQLKAPFHNLLGNHDYPKENDPDIHHKFEMPHSYYSLNKEGWKFIMLNTNELSEYATQQGTKEAEMYVDMAIKQKKKGREHVQPWNGGVSKQQITWLKQELKKAKKEGRFVVIFTHHPILPENGLETLNNRALLSVFTKYNCVKAVLSGHHHTGNYVLHQGLPFITLEGMVETQANSFGTLILSPDKLVIEGVGNMTSREQRLR